MIYAALIAYCTFVFGVHGGEGITGVNRQVRNLLCAIPFAAVSYSLHYNYALGIATFVTSYIGANMGFKDHADGSPNFLWLPVKGLVTFVIGGFIALPLAYWIGYKTRFKNVLAEYLSGTFYGLILTGLLIFN
jgi:hypothetical protein